MFEACPSGKRRLLSHLYTSSCAFFSNTKLALGFATRDSSQTNSIFLRLQNNAKSNLALMLSFIFPFTSMTVLKMFSNTIFSMCMTSKFCFLDISKVKAPENYNCVNSSINDRRQTSIFRPGLHEPGMNQGCQFCSVSSGMAETFHTNSKNGTKRNNFHLILNLGPFRIFQLNFIRNVPVSFHMFCSGLEKPLNQIEPGSI